MCINPELQVDIVDIEPEAVYQGTIYDQTVIARLDDDSKVALFDASSPSVKEFMVGNATNLHCEIQNINNIIKISDRALGVNQSTSPSSKWNYDFVGRVREIDQNNRSILFDIGVGTVAIVYYDDEIRNFIETSEIAIGTQLYIPDSRIDIFDVHEM